jgi:DNA-binding beta-propeller fold protein YncE
MYWVDQDTADVHRADLDGSGHQVLLTRQFSATGIALDLVAGKIYLTNQTGSIVRANLDGTNLETLVNGLAPFGIVLDVADNEMYWTNSFDFRDIRRAHLDGSGQQVLVIGHNYPDGLALDIASGKIYWVDAFGNSLWRDTRSSGLGQRQDLSDDSGGRSYPAGQSRRHWARNSRRRAVWRCGV